MPRAQLLQTTGLRRLAPIARHNEHAVHLDIIAANGRGEANGLATDLGQKDTANPSGLRLLAMS